MAAAEADEADIGTLEAAAGWLQHITIKLIAASAYKTSARSQFSLKSLTSGSGFRLC
jgi:hypothetical protein